MQRKGRSVKKIVSAGRLRQFRLGWSGGGIGEQPPARIDPHQQEREDAEGEAEDERKRVVSAQVVEKTAHEPARGHPEAGARWRTLPATGVSWDASAITAAWTNG